MDIKSFDPIIFNSLKSTIITNFLTDPLSFLHTLHTTPILGYSGRYLNSIICQLTSDKTRLKPLGPSGKIGIPYLLTIDKDEDMIEEYILKRSHINFDINLRESPPTTLSILTKYQDLLASCHMDSIENLENLDYLGLDEFTNEVMIAYILDYLLSQIELPTYLRHDLGFTCGSYGYNLMEYADMGTLDRVDDDNKWGMYYVDGIVDSEIIWLIIQQLVITLHYLESTVDYIHGDGKSANIFISSEPCFIKYYNIIVDSPITCKIGDYGKSSLTFNNIRIYNHNRGADAYLRLDPFVPRIELTTPPSYMITRSTSIQLYTRLRHMGVPYYRGYDIYAFIVSMLLHPMIFGGFFRDGRMRGLWEVMWFEEDTEMMYQRILRAKSVETHSFGVIYKMLKNVRLKCPITSILLDYIDSYYS